MHTEGFWVASPPVWAHTAAATAAAPPAPAGAAGQGDLPAAFSLGVGRRLRRPAHALSCCRSLGGTLSGGALSGPA